MGSIAIVLNAEYGDRWPGAISLTGSNWTRPRPAVISQRAKCGRSEISPIPQLSRDGMENSGTTTPARRPAAGSPSGTSTLHHEANALSEHRRLRQQTHNEKCLARKIEEEARVYQHAIVLEQVEHEHLFRLHP